MDSSCAGLSGSVDAPHFEVSSDTLYLQLLGGIKRRPRSTSMGRLALRRQPGQFDLEFPESGGNPISGAPCSARMLPQVGAEASADDEGRFRRHRQRRASDRHRHGRTRIQTRNPIFRSAPDTDSLDLRLDGEIVSKPVFLK